MGYVAKLCERELFCFITVVIANSGAEYIRSPTEDENKIILGIKGYQGREGVSRVCGELGLPALVMKKLSCCMGQKVQKESQKADDCAGSCSGQRNVDMGLAFRQTLKLKRS